MKKHIISIAIISLLFLLLQNLHAQDRSFGIKGGVAGYQIMNEVGNNSSTSDRKIAFEAGIYGEFPINRLLSIQPEVVFVQKGGEESAESFGNSSITLNYVDVPLLLKINAPVEGTIQPYIFGGPYAGYLIEAQSDTEGESQSLTEFLNEIHYGVRVGLGLNIGPVVIDARYDMGLANLYKEDEALGGNDSEFRLTTTGIVLSAGVRF